VTRSDDERIADILEASREVAGLVRLGREQFDTDRTAQLAIERLLEIVGEAARALDEETRERFPDVAWRDITRLRIVLAHHYHRVDPDQVWSIASVDIPALALAISPKP
jgi:uncharacterized protein with HEPN domain